MPRAPLAGRAKTERKLGLSPAFLLWTMIHKLIQRLFSPLISAAYNAAIFLGAISTQVDDKSSGWTSLSSRPNDRDLGQIHQLYRDALEATRKNPMAKAIVDITTDFVLGDGITISFQSQPDAILHQQVLESSPKPY